jgi:protein-tyrosine phosphatase
MHPSSFALGQLKAVELPLPFCGKIYCAPMPEQITSCNSKGLDMLEQQASISHIVLLMTELESFNATGCDLVKRYQERQIKVLHFPIEHGATPDPEKLDDTLAKTIEAANSYSEHRILIHCSDGIERTGLVVACLAKKGLKLSSEDAIEWAREKMHQPLTLQSAAHKQFVREYLAQNKDAAFGVQGIVAPRTENTLDKISAKELPLGLKSKVYCCLQPPTSGQQIQQTIPALRRAGIAHVVLLLTDNEIKWTGCNLSQLYEFSGMNVLHFPIKKGEVPEKRALTPLLSSIFQATDKASGNIMIHCDGAAERTVLVASCLTGKIFFGSSGDDAIGFVWRSLNQPNVALNGKESKFVNDYLASI